MKVANNITTNQTYVKQLKLPCRKMNQLSFKEITKSIDNKLQVVIEKKYHYIKTFHVFYLFYYRCGLIFDNSITFY